MLKQWIRYNVQASNEGSIAHRCRLKRMRIFEDIFAGMFSEEIASDRRISVLDVGGTWTFWKTLNFKYLDNIDLTLLNLEAPKIPEGIANVKGVAGDATDLSQYADKEFDLVFSNSVIEHVGYEPEQKKMADEIMRVGRHYYVQTPNKFFPIDPHFVFPPYFQFLPLRVKIYLLEHFALTGLRRQKSPSYEVARKNAEGTDLLTRSRLQKFFPDAAIQREKFMLMTKSFYLYA